MKQKRKALAKRPQAGEDQRSPLVVDTLGGHVNVRQDESSAPTPRGQLVFFADFLVAATGVFERSAQSWPLA